MARQRAATLTLAEDIAGRDSLIEKLTIGLLCTSGNAGYKSVSNEFSQSHIEYFRARIVEYNRILLSCHGFYTGESRIPEFYQIPNTKYQIPNTNVNAKTASILRDNHGLRVRGSSLSVRCQKSVDPRQKVRAFSGLGGRTSVL